VILIQEMGDGLSQQALLAWVSVSQLLWWLVLAFALLSLPIFLISMIIANLIMLSAICLNLILDYFFPSVKGWLRLRISHFNGHTLANIGSLLCKLTSFTTNTTACFVNWFVLCGYLVITVFLLQGLGGDVHPTLCLCLLSNEDS
jgi:hypothetical protein